MENRWKGEKFHDCAWALCKANTISVIGNERHFRSRAAAVRFRQIRGGFEVQDSGPQV